MRFIAPFVIILLAVGLGFAADIPKEPILRIETGLHTTTINSIAADPAGRWLVTASNDKSLRVWKLPEGRLSRTIHHPIGEGDEGKLFGVALSPDGSTIACGGDTKLGSENGYTIYLFNRASGNMTARITGLPGTVQYLAFSPDGRYLAATLGDKYGIRVYHSGSWAKAGEDKEYGDKGVSVHFSRDGRLVTTSYDGFIRLYEMTNGSLRMTAKVKDPGGSRPAAARFSPDGRMVAVGFKDTAGVSILSGHDLSHVHSPDTSDVKSGNMLAIAWSADGGSLFAGGRCKKKYNGVSKHIIRRWSDRGHGSYSDTPAADNTVFDLATLQNGQIAFGAAGPAFGLLDQSGAMTLFVPAVIADHRDNKGKFLVSADGGIVGFGYEQFGKSPATFDIASRNLTLDSTPAGMKAPAINADELKLTDWKSSTQPKINGRPLKLKPYERSISLAIAPDGNSFILGNDWSVRRFDRQGKQLWNIPVPGVAWLVNISGNGAVVTAGYGDGTIRWYRMSDGKELLALFPHSDRKRWVLWTPSGYYDASPGGEELIGWHINNGRDRAADFFPASRFRAAKYRPDVIAKILDTLDEGEAVRMAKADSGGGHDSSPLSQQLPPVVTITGPDDGARVTDRSVTVSYSVRTPDNAPVTGVRVLVDGRPVETGRGLKAVAKNSNEQTVNVTIPEKDCEISIIAENRHSASVPATVNLSWGGKKQDEFAVQPKLYVLSVGVSAYKDTGLTLKYAAKDAMDFANAVQRQKGGLYRDVTVKVLADAKATRGDIMDGLDWLQKEVTAKDVGIIFIAGHGVNDPTGIYYFLPQNADTNRLKRTGVAFSDIKNTLAALAGKAVLFVDTCHSGNIMGSRRGVADINVMVNELASSENGTVVFASSTGKQYSLEDEKWGNGAFTKALVEGLSGKADYGGKGKITVNMLDLYLSERVKELTKGQQTPTTTKPQTIQDFPLAVKR